MTIDESQPTGAATEEMRGYKILWMHLRSVTSRLRRRLPYLVWWNDEVDVTVTLTENRLPKGLTNENTDPIATLNQGAFYEIERRLNELGIEFDTGLGFGGRDWEWDWSLRGPIHIKFRGRSRKPERRN